MPRPIGLSGASACPPLREIPAWCNDFGGGWVEAANSWGWGNTCLPYTQAELLADNECIRRNTLTDPVAIAISKAADKQLSQTWPADAAAIERNPKLAYLFGTDAAGVLGEGVPVGLLALGLLVVAVLVVKR